ncbi:MAG: GNAT family N-acetyltransferase [Hyphomicrobiaceae bacterium]
MTRSTSISISPMRAPDDIASVRDLFTAYVDALGIDLSYQNFSAELATLPGKYAPPAGAILLARNQQGDTVGCVALRPLDTPGHCEMKRLYVRPEARGHDLGRRLAITIIACARTAGYARIVLDTFTSMQAARQLYATLGFREIAAYYDNPNSDVVYLALDL